MEDLHGFYKFFSVAQVALVNNERRLGLLPWRLCGTPGNQDHIRNSLLGWEHIERASFGLGEQRENDHNL